MKPSRAMSRREVLFPEGRQSVDVYPGDALDVDAVLEGPAIIEETTTTIVSLPSAVASRRLPCVGDGGETIINPEISPGGPGISRKEI